MSRASRSLPVLVGLLCLSVAAQAATPTIPTFVLAWSNYGAAPGQFYNPSGVAVDFATRTNPSQVAIGEVNGDGRPDLVVANGDSNTVSVLIGNGNGTFGTKTDVGTGADPSSVTQVGSCTLCWRNRPIEHCRAMILTDFGGYLQRSTIPGGEPLRVVADWGVLVNVDARNAIGASLFASFDSGDGVILGPAVRYRRWLSPTQSIDFAVGTPLYTSDYEAVLSAYGLIKYNPTHWIGFAVRPELRRHTSSDFGYSGHSSTRSNFVISAGVEFGWIPGFAMTVASGALGLLTLAALAASGS